VLGLDARPVAEQTRPLDDALEFADIARPVVVEHEPCCPGAQFPGATAVRGTGQKLVGEGEDVVAPLAQRWDVEFDGVETVVEVRPEGALGDRCGQVAVGRCDEADVDGQADVDGHWLGGAEADDLLVLKDAQEFDLEPGVEFSDFVEQEGASRGGLEGALAALVGAGEGPALVAE